MSPRAVIRSLTMAIACAAAVSFAHGSEAVWEALRTPGAVVVVRHSE